MRIGQPSSYLAELRSSNFLGHPSLATGSASPTGHELSVARTFALSWRRLDSAVQIDALARAALARAACFAPGEPFLRSWLHDSLEVGEFSADSSRLVEDALIRATELGLLEEPADGALALHRLVAHFVEMEGAYLKDAARDSVERVFLRLVEQAPFRKFANVGVPFALMNAVTQSSLPPRINSASCAELPRKRRTMGGAQKTGRI